MGGKVLVGVEKELNISPACLEVTSLLQVYNDEHQQQHVVGVWTVYIRGI